MTLLLLTHRGRSATTCSFRVATTLDTWRRESRTKRFTGVAQMFLRLPPRTNINTEFNTRGVSLSTLHWIEELQHQDAKAASAPFAAHAMK